MSPARGADAEDQRSVIRYAAQAESRFLGCRADGRHYPVREGGRWRDVRTDAKTGGYEIHTHCRECQQKMSRRLFADFTPNGGWKVSYEEGYLASPGEGTGLTSRAGRALFRQIDILGIDQADMPKPPAKKSSRKKA